MLLSRIRWFDEVRIDQVAVAMIGDACWTLAAVIASKSAHAKTSFTVPLGTQSGVTLVDQPAMVKLCA
jgi:hypothetical protein